MKKRKEKKHITEVKYPQQCKEFKDIVDALYLLHLEKNREYSPNNVKAIGPLGCTLRLIEKIIRLSNIMGHDIFTGEQKEPVTDLKFGSAEEELKDIATIAVITQIMMRDKWGK